MRLNRCCYVWTWVLVVEQIMFPTLIVVQLSRWYRVIALMWKEFTQKIELGVWLYLVNIYSFSFVISTPTAVLLIRHVKSSKSLQFYKFPVWLCFKLDVFCTNCIKLAYSALMAFSWKTIYYAYDSQRVKIQRRKILNKTMTVYISVIREDP